jgi:glutathione S-transferase
MRIIYTCPLPSNWCPVCGKVITAAREVGIDYKRKIGWFPRFLRKEVIRLTGQNRVPILIEDDGLVMRESRDIAAYLRKTYGPKT